MKISDEILATERTFVRDLDSIITVYKEKMEQLAYIDPTELDILFGNISELRKFHVKILNNMELLSELNGNIARAFLDTPEWIDLYKYYCLNHPKAVKMAKSFNEKENIKLFLLGCKLLASQDIALEGFLLLPIQRLCRYPLLLKELLKETLKTDVCYSETLEAFNRMKNYTQIVNDFKKVYENKVRLDDLRLRSDLSLAEQDLKVKPEQLIFQIQVQKISKSNVQDRTIFLTENVLFYAKENPMKKGCYQIKGKIPFEHLQVDDCSDTKINDVTYAHVWIIKRLNSKKPKIYYIVTKTLREKMDCLCEVNNALHKFHGVTLDHSKHYVPGQLFAPMEDFLESPICQVRMEALKTFSSIGNIRETVFHNIKFAKEIELELYLKLIADVTLSPHEMGVLLSTQMNLEQVSNQLNSLLSNFKTIKQGLRAKNTGDSTEKGLREYQENLAGQFCFYIPEHPESEELLPIWAKLGLETKKKMKISSKDRMAFLEHSQETSELRDFGNQLFSTIDFAFVVAQLLKKLHSGKLVCCQILLDLLEVSLACHPDFHTRVLNYISKFNAAMVCLKLMKQNESESNLNQLSKLLYKTLKYDIDCIPQKIRAKALSILSMINTRHAMKSCQLIIPFMSKKWKSSHMKIQSDIYCNGL